MTNFQKIEKIIEVTDELLFACESMHQRLHGTPDITGDCRFADSIAKAKALRDAPESLWA